MAYQALYRKYRSQRFDEMVGQEVVATTLKHAIVNHQISHAYLFSGPRGTGKTSAAKIFAKAINCPNQIDGEPCNNCFICDAITKGTLEDVIELDAASNNGVDEIREIRDKSTYAASQATYKVYIIDEVHMLSTGAFNALLKTLEEPTENVVFVLATTELQKIPATIISRVQRFAFKAITASDIRGHLEQVLADEKIDFEPTALDVIAKSAEGGMRDALSLLDQALSFSDGTLRENDALLVTGSIASQALENYVAALVSADEKSALLELDKIFAEGKNMMRFTEDLLAYFRDLLLKPSDIAHARLFAWIDIAIESLKTIKETTQTKIAADVMTMRLAEVDKNLSSSTSSSNVRSLYGAEAPSRAAALTESSMSGNNNSVSAATATNRFSGVASIDSVGAAVDDRNDNALQAEINQLKREIQDLKNQISSGQVSSALTKTSSEEKSAAVSHSVSSSSTSNHKVSRDLIYKALGEATREALTAASQAWPELVASITIPAERALLNNTKPAAAGQHYLVVTFPHENLARRVTENADLQLTCGNLLSSIAGFSPEIIALAESDWQEIRRDYVADFKAKKSQEAQDNAGTAASSSLDSTVENGDAAAMPESEENKPDDSLSVAKQLFGDKVIEIDD